MNVDALRLFIEVANKLGFAAVAADRGVSPSSVSRVIGQLESELGLRLFHRTTRTMTLTEAGDIYFRHVTPIIDALDEAEEAARLVSAGPQGTLRMTASVAFGERVIVPLLPSFRAAFPGVELDLFFTDANVDLVSEGIDLAVRLGSGLTGDIVATRLFRTAYRVVASKAYLEQAPPIKKPEDLEHHACTVFQLPAYRSAWKFKKRNGRQRGGVQAVPITGGTVVSSALSLRSVVLGGGGPALLADWLVADDIADGRLVDVLPGYDATATTFDTAAWLLYPSRAYLPQKVRVTIDFLKQQLVGAATTGK
ncbi:MAG: LysR family transcriptional regulator [Pseudomonadota bacterium]